MRDADGGVGGVDALAAGSARAEGIDAQVLLVDLDVGVLRFWQDGDGGGRRVDAAAGLGRRHALDAMHAALVLQLAVDAASRDRCDHYLDAAYPALAHRQRLDLPALALAEARVHAEQIRRE